MFDLPPELMGIFDFCYDSQCFHVLRMHDEALAVESIASLLASGGLLLVLTGNSNEPHVGPEVLSRDELKNAFVESGKFELLSIKEGRLRQRTLATMHHMQHERDKATA